MAATAIQLTAYGTSVTVLSGANELNSLANGTLGAVTGGGSGAVLDNTINLNLYADFELVTGTLQSAPTVGDYLALYMWTSVNGGTSYETAPAAGATTPPDSGHLVGNFVVETTGTSHTIHILRVPLTPGKHQFQLYNNSGAALPTSGASVVAYPYAMQIA